jgi:hypothetical protein
MSLMKSIRLQSPAAKQAITRWGELKTERARHETDWQLIAQLFRPLCQQHGMAHPLFVCHKALQKFTFFG